MSGRDIIVIGASAGGVETLCQLVAGLPLNLPFAIFIVLHVPSHGKSVLPKILNRAIAKQHGKLSLLQAHHPRDGELIVPGQIYVAPPDKHLLVKDNCIQLSRSARENSHRPAIDPLFRTAARTYGARVVGLVLSGLLDDGTAGLAAIKQCGGIAIAQDPEEALYPGMPLSAIENIDVDYVLKVADISNILMRLASEPIVESASPVSPQMEMEAQVAQFDVDTMQATQRPGTPSAFACPECSGVLWELQEGKLVRFRCRTGHAYSINTLLAEQNDGLEVALWSALRALEEKAALTERMAIRARTNSQKISAQRFQEQSQDSQKNAALVRQMLLSFDSSEELSVVNGQRLERNLESAIIANLSSSTPEADLNNMHVVAISSTEPKAVIELFAALDGFEAAMIVAYQSSAQDPSQLVDNLLNSSTSFSIKIAAEGNVLQPKTVYVVPKNRHLLVNPDGSLALLQSKLVHFGSPSADLLFESVAGSFREKAICVMLATNGDGIMGMRAIRETGGYAIVAQGEENMQETYLNIAQVVPSSEIAQTLINLAKEVE